jgi:2-iminobutanoate/2-iminopropanoate deaminase
VIERIRLADDLPEPLSHYSDAVRSGPLLWLSGLLDVDRNGAIVRAGDVVAQTEQIFRNLELVLTADGATFADVVKVTVYLRRIGDRAAVDDVRRRWFGDARPASTLIEVAALALDEALIEIEAVAYRERGRLS